MESVVSILWLVLSQVMLVTGGSLVAWACVGGWGWGGERECVCVCVDVCVSVVCVCVCGLCVCVSVVCVRERV